MDKFNINLLPFFPEIEIEIIINKVETKIWIFNFQFSWISQEINEQSVTNVFEEFIIIIHKLCLEYAGSLFLEIKDWKKVKMKIKSVQVDKLLTFN